jgi:hypothetical protein
MISSVLNKRNALRNFTDEHFANVLPQLALELSEIPYYIEHTPEVLRKDWQNLLDWTTNGTETASTTRVGMKLCEHYFKNFFHIKNSKGESFHSNWNPVVLEKVLRWNRKSHSTPYMSELRRGIYFCAGLTKNTMYRPHVAKSVATHYNAKVVLDPCSGWGGRLLGVVASGARYIGYEPNIETYNNLLAMVDFLNISDRVELYNIPAENMGNHEYDMVLTSPPYFNLEVYGDGSNQSENYFTTYAEWRDLWLKKVITNVARQAKVSCWNVHNVGKMKIIDDVIDIHNEIGYTIDTSFSLTSSKRQANQNISRNIKNKDLTNCFTATIL